MAPGVLLERDRERSELAAAVSAAVSGDGRIVSIVGSAGLGKTSLLGVGAQQAHAGGLQLARARASELERDLGWGLAAELLEQLLDLSEPAERAAALSGRAAAAEIVLCGNAEHEPASLSAGRVAAITVGLTLTVRRLAATRPLALIVDDVQWADGLSLRWLCHLAARIGECRRLLLLLGFRPEEPDAPRDLLRQIEAAGPVLRLAPLSCAAIATLVEADDEDQSTSRAVHAATGGNPFLIDQLVRHLDGAPRSVRDVQEARPERLRRTIEMRLSRLGEDSRALGQAVAVLGVATPLRRAARVCGLDAAAAAAAAERLSGAGILADRLPLAFAHPLLLEIVRDDVSAARMDTLRRRAARVLAEDAPNRTQAAIHLLAAEPVGEPWAGELLAEAGRRAFARAAHESAAAFLRRALVGLC